MFMKFRITSPHKIILAPVDFSAVTACVCETAVALATTTTPFYELYVGSTIHRVLLKAACPVVVIHDGPKCNDTFLCQPEIWVVAQFEFPS